MGDQCVQFTKRLKANWSPFSKSRKCRSGDLTKTFGVWDQVQIEKRKRKKQQQLFSAGHLVVTSSHLAGLITILRNFKKSSVSGGNKSIDKWPRLFVPLTEQLHCHCYYHVIKSWLVWNQKAQSTLREISTRHPKKYFRVQDLRSVQCYSSGGGRGRNQCHSRWQLEAPTTSNHRVKHFTCAFTTIFNPCKCEWLNYESSWCCVHVRCVGKSPPPHGRWRTISRASSIHWAAGRKRR